MSKLKILTRGEVEVRLSRMYEASKNDVEGIYNHDQALRELVKGLATALEDAAILDLGTENDEQIWHCEECGGNGFGDGEIDHNPHCSVGDFLARAKAVADG